MNVFNRIVMILLILGLLALCVVMLVEPQAAVETAIYLLSNLQASGYISGGGLDTYYVVGVAIAVVVLLMLLFLEVRRGRKKSVRIKTEGNGQARIGVDSVVQSLVYRIDELPGVRDAKAHITSRGNDVAVVVDLHTSPTVNVPAVTGQVVKLAHEIIEAQLGVKIHGKVQVNVAHEPFPRGTMAPGAPTPRPEAKARPETMIPPLAPEAQRPKPEAQQPTVGATPGARATDDSK